MACSAYFLRFTGENGRFNGKYNGGFCGTEFISYLALRN